MDKYVDFVLERHRIWERRQYGLSAPWTTNQILATRKYTNVYRILDAGTQFIVRDLFADTDPHTALMRCFLYRYTNRPEPWVYFQDQYGRYPESEDLADGTLLECWRGYKADGGPIFSSAYKMFVGQENKGTDRLTWAVNFARDYFTHHETISDHFFSLDSMADRVAYLRTIPRCARFMSMQILTDIGYSVHAEANENEFIVAGPGARRGAVIVMPDEPDAEKVIRELTAFWADQPISLQGRSPSLMDVQNTLCEMSKYDRHSPSKKLYEGHGTPPEPFLPAHWKVS